MVVLTRLDGKPVLINLVSVKYIEAVPDTLVVFMNGDSLLVRETLGEIEARVVESKAKILAMSRNPDALGTGASPVA